MYSYAWYKDPIVTGLIMDSGSSFIESGAGPRYSNFSYVAGKLGCSNNTNAAEELACMKRIDAASIENIIADELNGGSKEGLAFGPSADERIIFSNYTDRALQGKLARVVSAALSTSMVQSNRQTK
jgi:cholinesterase